VWHETIQYTQQEEAKKAVYLAIWNGNLSKAYLKKCTDCSHYAEVYDHRDYAKPLDVEPVCRRCNVKRGAGLNKI
jgi:hypothetical protein